MKLQIKKLVPEARIPQYANKGDAGLDLTVTELEQVDNKHIKYKFGIAIKIPDGYVGLVFPRSSIYKQRQVLSNSVGVIDSQYIGEIMAVMIGTTNSSYKIGERACQLVIMPYSQIEFEEVEELENTERGANGYGSSGK